MYADTPVSVKEAFARADSILKDAVMGISELITVYSDGGIMLDFRDVETTMRNGGGAIMATGRASGEKRVERAIKNALESPLIYGSDISHAKRILFNIYSSDEMPVMVPEMQEIDDFFDSLNPEIEVIWGLSTDNGLGEDVKVIILATGMEENYEVDDDLKDDDYYESLIPKLYKPIEKPLEEPIPDPPLEVVQLPEPVEEEDIPQPVKDEKPGIVQNIMNGAKRWLMSAVE